MAEAKGGEDDKSLIRRGFHTGDAERGARPAATADHE
jgi:hypothetical protein